MEGHPIGCDFKATTSNAPIAFSFETTHLERSQGNAFESEPGWIQLACKCAVFESGRRCSTAHASPEEYTIVPAINMPTVAYRSSISRQKRWL